MKTMIIKIYPTQVQTKILNEFIDTYRYVYNKTLKYVKNFGYEPNFYNLRDFLATENTKNHYTCYKIFYKALELIKEKYKIKTEDSEDIIKYKEEQYKLFENELIKDSLNIILKNLPSRKNDMIRDFELRTSNEIRSNAIKSVCDAYTTSIKNLKNGNIKYFDISFKKNDIRQTIELSTTDFKYINNGFKISPSKFPVNEQIINISKRNIKKLNKLKNINSHNCDLVRTEHGYFIHLTLDIIQEPVSNIKNVCGIDPGVRSLLTIYSNKDLCDFKNDFLLHKIKKHNTKIDIMKYNKKKCRKKHLYKHEKKKKSLMNEIHWKTINYLIKEYDVIYLGDIKSSKITKGNNNILNRNMNDLQFFKFKQRLHYKCIKNNKKMFLINEAYTTQGCSSCGNLWKDIGTSKVYDCQNIECDLNCGRDYNSAKNIYMKGILSC